MPKKKIKRTILEIIGAIIGAAIMAFGVASFLLPNQLSSGGVSGITTITYYLLNIPMGTMIIAINIPLFLFAWYRLGKKFLVKSIIGTVSLSLFIDILDKYPPVTTDKFLASIYGGVIIGIGTAIILKSNSSSSSSTKRDSHTRRTTRSTGVLTARQYLPTSRWSTAAVSAATRRLPRSTSASGISRSPTMLTDF